jgi:hypothetical protein
MTAPINSNSQIAILTLERLGFVKAIGWKPLIDGGRLARWRKDDLLATLVLEGRRLSIALTSATDHRVPCQVPTGANAVAQALNDAGVVCGFRPEGVWP